MTRVLLVRLSAMGDIVQSLGAVRALARECPELELHFLVQRPYLPLLQELGFLTSSLAHDRRPVLTGVFSTVRRLRRLKPDIALDLQGNWKSAAMVRLCGAPRRIGIGGPMRREESSEILLNERVVDVDSPHPARLALEVVRVLAPDAPELMPSLVATEEEMAREAKALAALGLPAEEPICVLVMAHPADPRAWPRETRERESRERGRPCVWLAGPDETGVDVPDGVRVLHHGRGELRRLVGLGGQLARCGGEVIGPDRGTLHVLAACGPPTTVLFGPQDPRRTAPPSARVLVHRHAPGCSPCSKRRCFHPQGPVCMAFTTREGRVPGG